MREIEAAIEAAGLGGVARLIGLCDDMPAELALAHVVAALSVGTEAFGRVPVEARAMTRPVVVTDVSGPGETLLPAATGWLVPPGDVDELARALGLALDDVRARLAVRARSFVTVHRRADVPTDARRLPRAARRRATCARRRSRVARRRG